MYTPNYDLTGRFVGVQLDGQYIPNDLNNSDYRQFVNWLAEQNLTVDAWLAANPYVPPVVDPKATAINELSARMPANTRVSDDLLEALVAKGVLALTDLPQAAQDKYAQRQALRAAAH